jgi:hypothetical protein
MKWVLLTLALFLVTAAGCTCYYAGPDMPTGNQLPIAYIDSITPSEVTTGALISFHGHGTDRDGTIVGYSWRSDVDGVLSSTAIFETGRLSAGIHTIYFKVQDNSGAWSGEVIGTVTVTGTAATGEPVIYSFTADPGSIAPGGYIILSWDISGATSASIDQGIGNVALKGVISIAPATITTYTLTASNAMGTVTARARVMVAAPPVPTDGLPNIELFLANPMVISAGATATLTWNVTNATQVSISPIIGDAGLSGSILVAPYITTLYTLIAINPAGATYGTVQVVIKN